MKIKPNKQVQIDFIVSCLQNAEERSVILAKVGKSWQTTTRTFDRLFKTAKEQLNKSNTDIKSRVMDNTIDKEVEAKRLQIEHQIELDEQIYQIAIGKVEVETLIVINGTIERVMTKPDHSDILKAYDLYNKRFGSNAPVKTDSSTINTITINGG